MPWNPDQYHKFQSQRAAPFEDIVKLILVRSGLRVIDLGCGTGELTRKLADRLPDCDMVGMDSSPEMLAHCEPFAREGLRFELGTVEDFAAVDTSDYDLVFSHATLHWIDNHPTLMPRILHRVCRGGQIAVQMPSNHQHIAQSIVRDIVAEEPFRTALGGFVRYSPVLGIDAYADMLFANSFTDIQVFEKVYPQVLENSDAVTEFTRGTVLIPYFERLPEDMREALMETYRERLRSHMPGSPVFYGFRRTIFVGTKV